MAEHGRRVISVLLAIQGGLILLGAILVGLTGTAFFPFDTFVGTDSSVAALVLGAAFIMAFRNPTPAWVNLAILYNVLTIVFQMAKWGATFGVRPTLTATVISAIFLIAYLIVYPIAHPRGGALGAAPTA